MAIDHDGDTQCLTEVIEDNGGSTSVSSPVTAAHTARFVQQQSYGEGWDLIGQCIFVKDPAIVAAQSVDIQAAAHQEAGLLPATAAVVHLLQNGFLKLF